VCAGLEWKLDPGEGAFYGPKIDITVYDALRRKFQCATVQLDFQLPIRFNLNFWDDAQQPQRPVIVHRAILGSVERMFAILTEHFAQKWPFWLSPRQVRCCASHPLQQLCRAPHCRAASCVRQPCPCGYRRPNRRAWNACMDARRDASRSAGDGGADQRRSV
jgi:hypothetical protein